MMNMALARGQSARQCMFFSMDDDAAMNPQSQPVRISFIPALRNVHDVEGPNPLAKLLRRTEIAYEAAMLDEEANSFNVRYLYGKHGCICGGHKGEGGSALPGEICQSASCCRNRKVPGWIGRSQLRTRT